MADQKIELEIVLDDGSIKKAFGTIRREAEVSAKESAKVFQEEFAKQEFIKNAFDKQNIGNALSKILRSDDVAKSAKDSAEFFSEQFSKNLVIKEDLTFFKDISQSLVGVASGLFIFGQVRDLISSITDGFKRLSLEAENIRAINAQFVSLTQQSKISTEDFATAIEKSVAGLMGNEEVLQLANNAMIRLGSTASRLPEIFELSRKAAAGGFGEIKTNVEIFTNAIQTSNARQLRALGINVDLAKAQRDFAASLRLTTDQLTPQQREFVNVTAIIKQANQQYIAIDTSTRKFSESLARLGVASTNLFEKFAIGFDSAFGSTFKRIVDDAVFAIGKLTGTTTVEQKIEQLRYRLKELNQSYEDIARSSKLVPAILDVLAPSYNEATLKNIRSQMQDVRAEIELLTKQITKPIVAAPIVPPGLTAEQIAIQEQRQQQLYQSQVQFQQQEIAARQSALQYEMDDMKRREEMEFLHTENLRVIVENGAIARANIEKQYSDAKGFDLEQRNLLINQQIAAQNAQVLAAEKKYQDDSLDQFDKMAQQKAKQLSEFSVIAKTFFFNTMSQGFQSFGAALVKGEDGFAAFGKAFLGILGDLAIQMGNVFIAAGIANQFIPLFGFVAGTGSIIAGAALVALGGALKALSGGAGGAGAATAGGGGVAAEPQTVGGFNAGAPITDTRMTPSTVVNFTIQGDVLDSDLTQNRIVQLLNDAIDTKGAVVRGMA